MSLRLFQLFVLITIVLKIVAVRAAEIEPAITDNKRTLTISIRNVEYPDSLSKDIVSGLTTKLFIGVAVLIDGKRSQQRSVDLWIKYDLWDENFAVALKIERQPEKTKTYATKQLLMKSLATIELPGLYSMNELQDKTDIVFLVDLVLNPIKQEKIDRIKKWVSENSVSQSVGTTNTGVTNTSGARTSNMFKVIVEQYDLGDKVAASWRETIKSKPINIQELLGEERKD